MVYICTLCYLSLTHIHMATADRQLMSQTHCKHLYTYWSVWRSRVVSRSPYGWLYWLDPGCTGMRSVYTPCIPALSSIYYYMISMVCSTVCAVLCRARHTTIHLSHRINSDCACPVLCFLPLQPPATSGYDSSTTQCEGAREPTHNATAASSCPAQYTHTV